MLPRDKGGVVDSKLKVYGTKNIRVADASILPVHISGHPQGMYWIAVDRMYSNIPFRYYLYNCRDRYVHSICQSLSVAEH